MDSHHAWTDIGIKAHLEQYFNIPILLENDNNLAAIGEMHLGHDEQLEDLIYVSCGTGLGSGIIINGQIYKGFNRAAGEMGTMMGSDGKRIEDAVGIDGLLKRIEQALAIEGRNLKFSQIVEMAKGGNLQVNKVIREIGKEIGRVAYNASLLLDIQTIVIGGDYLKLGQAFFDGIEDAVPQNPHFRPRVIGSTLKESAGIFGSFVLGKNEILNRKLMTVK